MHPIRCAPCTVCGISLVTDQAIPLCGGCDRRQPPAPPPMRTPLPGSLIPTAGSMLVVLVFIAGVAVGAKMAGGW